MNEELILQLTEQLNDAYASSRDAEAVYLKTQQDLNNLAEKHILAEREYNKCRERVSALQKAIRVLRGEYDTE